MDVLACVCTAIATALTIFISEAIWQRHKSKTENTKGHQSSVSNSTETKTYSSEAVQVPETNGLDCSAGSENSDTLRSYTDCGASQRNRENRCSEEVNETMGEKDNLAKIKVVTSELTDNTQLVKSDGQALSADLERKVYIQNEDENDLNEVFFNFEKTDTVSAKEDVENNVDVVADNNRNHETETKCYPKRTRRMSDVIDSIGDSFSSDKSGRYSRKSSSSSPPATPPSDAGYSSVHSTPSHTKPARVTHCRVNDTTDAGCGVRAKYENTGAGPTDVDENETTDAGPITQQFDDLSDMIVGGPVVEAVMPVTKHAEEYNMNHHRRGHAIIFNNDTFDSPDVSNRSGSEADVKNLNRLFTALEFQITVHHNKEYSEIKKILHDLSKEDHSDADCIVVTVLTHGLRQGYILSKDVPYSVDYLWKPFTADKCTTLAGKPKIFIVQACRGDTVDSGVKLVKSRTETDSSQEAYKIPTHADFLIAYSSAEGFYSWRNPESGTWFIQCLCEELIAHAATTDFLKILTRTARRVAVDFESFNDDVLWQHEKKQIPCVTTMLIRDVYFRPKK